jgi:hypothetical protein
MNFAADRRLPPVIIAVRSAFNVRVGLQPDKVFDKSYHLNDDARQGGPMRIGIIFGLVLAIILATILWKRGKPPVP